MAPRTLGEHPGFQAVAQHIASASNMPIGEADAVLAKHTRDASPAAKRANPRLKRVKSKRSGKGRGGKSNPHAPSNSYMFNDHDADD